MIDLSINDNCKKMADGTGEEVVHLTWMGFMVLADDNVRLAGRWWQGIIHLHKFFITTTTTTTTTTPPTTSQKQHY